MTRSVAHRYEDPLDAIWRGVARDLGLQVVRSEEVFASTDGRGTLTLGTQETLDADDCLAQMIFHEICHALVQAPEGLTRPDWGLDNESSRDLEREHACLRLQATLAERYGLRQVLAPTTDHRAFYDALPSDPLAGAEKSVVLARAALQRLDDPPWPIVLEALDATRRIAAIVGEHGPGADSLWSLLNKDGPERP